MTAPALSPLAEKIRVGDRDRFEAALFAPRAARENLITLYAFNLEIARAPWVSAEPNIVAIRLRWWLDAIAEAYDGASPRAHEVAGPLHGLIQGHAPDRVRLERMTEARLREIEPAPFTSLAELETHLLATAGELMALAARLLAPDAPSVLEATALDLGVADGAARALAATPELASRGRTLLPLDESTRARLFAGEETDALGRAACELGVLGLKRLARARARRRSTPTEASPVFLSAWRAERILRAAAMLERRLNRGSRFSETPARKNKELERRPKSGGRFSETPAQKNKEKEKQNASDLQSDALGTKIFRDLGPESEFRRRASLLWRGACGRW